MLRRGLSTERRKRKRRAAPEASAAAAPALFVEDRRADTTPARGPEAEAGAPDGSLASAQLEAAVFGFGTDLAKVLGRPEEEAGEDGEAGDGDAPLASQKPAWHDDDDDTARVDISEVRRLRKLRRTEGDAVVSGQDLSGRLRGQFEKIYGQPTWAAVAESDGEQPIGLLQTSKALLDRRSGPLPRSVLDVTRMRDANHASVTQAVVQRVRFHPSAAVMFAVGLDKTLRLFQIDGKHNPVVQTVFFKDLPIHQAEWSHNGAEIVLAGRRPYFYVFSLRTGQSKKITGIQGRTEKSFERFAISPDDRYMVVVGDHGTLIVLSNETKRWAANLKMNGAARHIAFSPDGKLMFTSGDKGMVYVWDMDALECQHVFRDEGCVHASSIAISPTGQHVACGSDSGVVNLYDVEAALASREPKPLKAVLNLTTAVDCLSFNHDGQLLCFSSKIKKSHLRVLHVASLSVMKNWPTPKTPLNYTKCHAFSPGSGYLATGNDKGKVQLFRLNYYASS